MSGPRGRWTAAVLAAVVALTVALVVSMASWPALAAFAAAHGEPGVLAWLYPAMTGGLTVAAALVLLWAARTGIRAPWLAWLVFTAGVAFTGWAVWVQEVPR